MLSITILNSGIIQQQDGGGSGGNWANKRLQLDVSGTKLEMEQETVPAVNENKFLLISCSC